MSTIDKAEALSQAWRARYGSEIGRNALLLLLSVADLETGMGEYRGVKGLQLLPGPSHNWGQIQRRTMTAAEKAQFAAGSIPPPRDDNEFLSGDTSPDTGAYRVWLWRFPDDVQGATKLLAVLVDVEKIRDSIEGMSAHDLARSMYNARYYEGAFSRSTSDGPEKNILAYGNAIASHATKLFPALKEWPAGTLTLPEITIVGDPTGGSGGGVVALLFVVGGVVWWLSRGV